ncbi:MAG: hypothetical protein Q9182_006069 [Xanthomendoza sp. 2 TL-2023]
MRRSLIILPGSVSFIFHSTAQVTDFIPFNSLSQYQLLRGCPKTYLDREAYSQFKSYLCHTTQRTAECVCIAESPNYRISDVASRISSVINKGCTVLGEASSAKDVFYGWCITNNAAIVAAQHGIAIPTDSSPGPITVPATTTAVTPSPSTLDTNRTIPMQDDKRNPGLSAGDIAGIVVAIAVFIGTLTGTVLLERRRRAATASHYSWLSKVDHICFVVINKAARPFHDQSPRLDPRDQTREERIMRQPGPRKGRLALEILGEAREADGRGREV